MPDPATVDCDPQALIEAAKCYKCIPNGLELPVIIKLLQDIGGDTRTPQELITASRCYDCIPVGLRELVVILLLCELVNA